MLNLANYGSDEEGGSSGSDSGAEGVARSTFPRPVLAASASPSPEAQVANSSPSAGDDDEIGPARPPELKKRKVDLSRLPIARPHDLYGAAADVLGAPKGALVRVEVAPLKDAAEVDNMRVEAGRSLLDFLPAPRATLGASAGDGAGAFGSAGGLKIDLSGIKKKKAAPKEASPEDILKPVASLLDSSGAVGSNADFNEVPESALSHALFGGVATAAQRALTKNPRAGQTDGPTNDDIDAMRTTTKFTQIAQDDLRDANWETNVQNLEGGPGLHKGKSVPLEISGYDAGSWQKTTHANPSRVQKRKHQINWLAQEAMDQEAELMDRGQQSRLTKAQTQAKYGW